MNKNGQTWAYAIMLSMVLIILVLALASPTKTFIDNAMGNSTADFIGLGCDSPSSNFVAGTCTILDFSLAYVIGGMLLIAVGVIGARFIFSGGSS